jgi:DNA-binding beta-propeller fold protein YncE
MLYQGTVGRIGVDQDPLGQIRIVATGNGVGVLHVKKYASLLITTLIATSAVASGAADRSPFDLAFSPDGRKMAVSDRTAACLYVVDMETPQVDRTIPLQVQPMALAWRGNGTVFVAEYDNGTVAEVDTDAGEVVRRLRVGPKPVGVAVAAKKNLLIVTNYGLNTVSLLNLSDGEERACITAGPRPYFVTVTPDETMAVVANLLPTGPATDPAAASVITLVDLDCGTKIKDIVLPDSSSNVRQVAVSPDGRWAYTVHTRGRTTLPTTQLERGWVNTNALSVVDLAAKELYATVLLDTVAEGAADPWGIAVSSDARTAWITVAGVHEIARIELARLHDFMAGRGDIKSLGLHDTYAGPARVWMDIEDDPKARSKLSYHLAALYAADMLHRVNIDAKGPRGVDLSPDGKTLAVASYFTGEVLLLEPDTCKLTRRIDLGPQPRPNDLRHGEFVFHNGQHSFQHWLSCATCHPDGRADALNWDLLNDGIGNPKNTKSLLWSHKTPPVMSLGVRESMDEAALKGFQFIQFREVEEGDLEAVRAYIR